MSMVFQVQGARNIAVHSMLEASVVQLGGDPVRLGDWLRGRGHPWTPPDGHGEAVKPLRRLQLQILSREVTGCNLPGGNDPFLEARRGPASRHCSYENNAD